MVEILQAFIQALVIFFAVIVTLCLIATLVYDIWAINTGRVTISRTSLELGARYPVFAVAVSSIICLAVGMLLGHLFFGQYLGSN
jgi:hypothetical protein